MRLTSKSAPEWSAHMGKFQPACRDLGSVCRDLTFIAGCSPFTLYERNGIFNRKITMSPDLAQRASPVTGIICYRRHSGQCPPADSVPPDTIRWWILSPLIRFPLIMFPKRQNIFKCPSNYFPYCFSLKSDKNHLIGYL